MKFRKLRMAFTISCGIACLLLTALWVRSGWRFDDIVMPFPYVEIQLGSSPGTCGIAVSLGSLPSKSWTISSTPYDDPLIRYVATAIPLSSPIWGEFHQKFAKFGDSLFGSVGVPYWFAILLVTILTAAPWVRWRFTLRTLLIATTLIAVALGLIVWLR
jgi:hypothetical protein